MASARKFQIGDLVGEYRDLGSSVMTIDSSGDVILLASKRVLQFINLSAPKHPHRIPRKNVKWEVNAAQWNPHKSSGTVFVVTRNNQADICSFQDGKYEVKSTLQSHTRSITDLDWSHSSSNLLLTCSSDSNALLWDVRTCSLSSSKPVQTFETMQSCSTSQVKWNKLEENIFATSQDRDIRIWDTRKTDRPVYISGHLKKIHGLDWSSHNSKLLASASEDGSVKFWDYTQGPQSNNIGGLMSNNSRSPVWKARFAPFENSLLTIDVSPLRREGDNSLMLWDIADLTSPDLKFTFVGHSDVVTEFQWRKPTTENQFQLVTWSRDQTLRMCKYEPADGGHKVIDINMERQSNGTENGSPPVYDHTPPNGVNGDHQNGVEPTVTVLPRPGVSSSATADEEGTDDDDDDDSSQDDIIPPSTRSPARHTRNHLRPNQPKSNSASPTLPTRQPHPSPHTEDLELSQPVILQQENTTSGDNFYCDDDDDDDDEAIPTSPNPYGSTLQNEFRFLSTISGVSVRFELSQRKSFVAINNIGEHKINLIISFPDMYPEETPVFRFDPSTTIEEALQLKLIIEMNDAASPLISRSKACVEKCIHKLKSTVEEMYANNSLESDPRHQSGQASLLSQQLYNNNIPYPRTCGARFCNDKLVTFQRPVHPAQSTPRSLSDANSSHTPHISRTRSTFFTPLSRSPKDSHSFFTKRGHRQRQLKKEKSGPITVYDISSLLPVNKSMALECRLDATAAACRHNAEVAVAHGRRDLHQIWKLIEEFMDDRLTAPSDPNDLKSGVPWAFLPMGRPMVESIIRHYSSIGDFQTLSILACMFPYDVPSSIPSVEIERPLQQFNLQRSSSNMKLLGTSPASSLTGRSPPEKGYLSIEPNNTDGLTYGWSTSSRRRADSHNGSLQDITRNSYPYPGDPDNDVQKHKSDAQILDPTKGLLYDFYKTQYGDILYSWGFLEERLELLKTSASQPNQELSALSLTCGTCFEAYQDSWCANCKRQKLKCALCRSGVKGPAALCVTCGHGGHTQHMKLWFETETECASGCGCKCLTTNTEER